MSLADDVEKIMKLRKPHVAATAEMDKRTLDDSFAAMDSAIEERSKDHRPNVWVRVRITRFAAAAMVILAIGFFIGRSTHTRYVVQPAPKVEKSSAEMMTLISLNMAYRKGGMEAVETQCDKAFKMLGPRQEKTSVRQLLAEFNGT